MEAVGLVHLERKWTVRAMNGVAGAAEGVKS